MVEQQTFPLLHAFFGRLASISASIRLIFYFLYFFRLASLPA